MFDCSEGTTKVFSFFAIRLLMPAGGGSGQQELLHSRIVE